MYINAINLTSNKNKREKKKKIVLHTKEEVNIK